MLLKYVLDTSNLVFCLAFGQLRRSCSAIKNRSICREFWDFCELLGISRLRFRCRRWRRRIGCLFSHGGTDNVQSTGSYAYLVYIQNGDYNVLTGGFLSCLYAANLRNAGDIKWPFNCRWVLDIGNQFSFKCGEGENRF